MASLAAKRNEAVPNDNALASQAAALVDIDNPILRNNSIVKASLGYGERELTD